MSGGLCFILHGNMGTGTMKSTTLFRVGKPKDAAALASPGPCFILQHAKAMASFVELPTEDCGDVTRRAALSGKALACAKALPPK